MGVLDSATLLLQAKNYSGSGDWLDESGNGHDGVITGASYVSDGIDSHFALSTGDYMTIADHADLDFGAADSFSLMVVGEVDNAPGTQTIIAKKIAAGSGTAGYYLQFNGLSAYPAIADTAVLRFDNTPNVTANQKFVIAAVRNVVDGDLEAFLDGTGSGSPTTDTTTLSLSNGVAMTIGRQGGGTESWDGKIYAVVMWRRALSPAELVMAQEELEGTTRSLMDRAVLKLQAKNHSGTGDWLDESGFDHDATPSGATHLAHDGEQYLYLPGATGNYADSPDSAGVSVTGDIDLRCKVRLTSTVERRILSKYFPVGDNRSFSFYHNNLDLKFDWSPTGSSSLQTTASTVGIDDNGFALDEDLWIRVTLDADNGASGYDVKFWTSPDGTTWTQLGTTVVGGATTSIFDGTADVEIGAVSDGSAVGPYLGRIYKAQIYDGIAGTLAFDADFTDTAALTEPFATFTEKSANAATVTINRAASGYVSTVVDRAMWIFDGTNDSLKATSHADLEFGANDSFTLMTVARVNTVTGNHHLVDTKTAGTTDAGYNLWKEGDDIQIRIGDGAGNVADTIANTVTARELFTAAGVRNVTDDDLEVFFDGSGSGTPTTDSTTAGLVHDENFVIGAYGSGGNAAGGWWWGSIVAVVLWREALTDAEIASAGEALLQSWDGTWDGEILATVKNHLSVTEGGELLAVLQAQGATSKETVGALNELNGTTGVGFQKALRTYLGVT